MLPDSFHPLIRNWFDKRFRDPTEPQRRGWPEILAGRDTLIAAPTGSGKTLAAFLAAIDSLLRQSLEGSLTDATQVLYVSPLKALSNDIERNLVAPLAEIEHAARDAGHEPPPIRVQVRTGDTPPSQREAMRRRPPHIIVTTPESLYLLLTSPRGRAMLRTVRTVIVDEIHAVARDKRGSHLALSLERLEALAELRPVRIGLSATQRPIDEIARFLVGGHPGMGSSIIDTGHVRELDLGVEVPPSELSAVCSHEQWGEIYQRLAELIQSHRSTLVFVNTRRLAERVCHQLSQLLGEDAVASHHGSLSRETRLAAESRLKSGELRAIVATASLELGIDIGFIDLVCQIGSPRSIATFLQRIGRSGHSLHATPKGRLFALTRDELLESMALVRAVRQGRLDRIEIPRAPLDILAQQIVAAVSCEEWDEDALYELCRAAWPYRDLKRSDYDAVVAMLSEGIGRGNRRGAYLHRDIMNRRLRPRRGARIAAVTSGGAIPEMADYRVVTDDGTYVGTLNEDFAIESSAGDVFLLGNTSWRIIHVRGGQVIVADAQGAPATIPFWLGEAPARTIELSAEVSTLRRELEQRVESQKKVESPESSVERSAQRHNAPLLERRPAHHDAVAWLCDECAVSDWAAEQAAQYVAAQKAAIGVVPSQQRVVFERFFDESGGMQLVIHAPFGGRINRGWGLAMRKRFCRSFDFELQASADDNGILLSLGPQHSFPIEQMFAMLRPDNAEHLLTQALLAVPMFQTRWRWNVTRALAVLRQHGGKKVPPPLQRFRSDDLLTAVFPAQTACFEHRPEDLEIPDHPLVHQTVYDCLHEAMDIDGLRGVLEAIERGAVELVARDTREPSPFSYQILNAQPYAFLDDAPLEERRARAVATRRTLDVESVRDLAWLDPAAIARVRSDAWPLVRDADELHDALLTLGALPEPEGAAWAEWFRELCAAGRATALRRAGPTLWVAAERWPLVQAALPGATPDPPVCLPESLRTDTEPSAADAWGVLVRGRLECGGPLTASQIAEALGLERPNVEAALEALEGEGFALRGRFTPQESPESSVESPEPDKSGASTPDSPIEWCERRLLARIHRLTLDGLRRQIQPVEPADYLRFLVEHQRVLPAARVHARVGLAGVIAQLQGYDIPAGAWELDVLPVRVSDYDPSWLDELSLAGEVTWGRLCPPRRAEDAQPSSTTITRVVPIALALRADLPWLLPTDRPPMEQHARSGARLVFDTLQARGALFFDDLRDVTGLLPAQLEDALGELAALGLVTADGFASIRPLVTPGKRRALETRRPWTRRGSSGQRAYARGGRWSLFPGALREVNGGERAEAWARQLLDRYGVVFRDLLARETAAPPWRMLAPVYRRLEARGEIRGGRFVAGVAGEQFATTEAVDRLRRLREEGPSGEWVVVSAADPLNLVGVLTPGPRIPATRTNSLVLSDGRLVASHQGREIQFHARVERAAADEMIWALRMSGLARMRHQAARAAGRRVESADKPRELPSRSPRTPTRRLTGQPRLF